MDRKYILKTGIKYTEVSGVLHECEMTLAWKCPNVVSFYSLIFTETTGYF